MHTRPGFPGHGLAPASSGILGWCATDLAAEGGAESTWRLIADIGSDLAERLLTVQQCVFGQRHAPCQQIFDRCRPDDIDEASGKSRARHSGGFRQLGNRPRPADIRMDVGGSVPWPIADRRGRQAGPEAVMRVARHRDAAFRSASPRSTVTAPCPWPAWQHAFHRR